MEKLGDKTHSTHSVNSEAQKLIEALVVEWLVPKVTVLLVKCPFWVSISLAQLSKEKDKRLCGDGWKALLEQIHAWFVQLRLMKARIEGIIASISYTGTVHRTGHY